MSLNRHDLVAQFELLFFASPQTLGDELSKDRKSGTSRGLGLLHITIIIIVIHPYAAFWFKVILSPKLRAIP